jgi:hypothetical protein
LSELEVVARLAPAAPGAIIGLPFFDGLERSVGFTLQRIDRENEVAVPLYWMTSAPAGGQYDGPSSWGVWTGTPAVPAVLVSSVGVDLVPIPETAVPGEYLVCGARCFELRIVPPGNDLEVLALLPPAAPGSLVELPFDDGRSRGIGFKIVLAGDPATPLWALTSDGNGGSPSWTPWPGGFDLPLVSGGSDQVLIPDEAAPGSYLICHALGEPFCFWIQVADDAPVTTSVMPECQPLFQPLGGWVTSCLIGTGSPVPVDSPIVVAGSSGVHVVDSDGAFGLVLDQPVGRAFIVGDALVTQGSSDSASFLVPPEGPVTVTDVSGTRTFSLGQRLELFDAGLVNGRPVMLVAVTTGFGPDDLEQRLLLVDLGTLEPVDLGVVGGWESGVASAKLSPEVVVHASVFGGSLTAVELDGTLKWERSFEWSGGEAGEIVVAGGSLLLVEPRFVGDEFAPFLDITELELVTGIELGSVELALTLPEGVVIEGAFCPTAEYATSQLICSQSYGPPLVIDLETGEVLLLPVGTGAIPTPAR